MPIYLLADIHRISSPLPLHHAADRLEYKKVGPTHKRRRIVFLVISKKRRKSVEQEMRVLLVPDRTACHVGGWEVLV
jgi:hypothetical protein